MTEDEANADMSLAHLEAQANIWAEQINLNAMIDNVLSPMRLNRNVPDDIKVSFAKRMKEQIDALMRQAFMEGAERMTNEHGCTVEGRPSRLPTTVSVGTLVARKCRNHPPCDCPGDQRCAPPRCWVED